MEISPPDQIASSSSSSFEWTILNLHNFVGEPVKVEFHKVVKAA